MAILRGRLFGGGELCERPQPAEAPFAAVEIGERRAQIVGTEIGPERIDKAELRVSGFPQQEVRQSLFAAGADEQIDVGAGLAGRRGEQLAESLARGRLRGEPTGRRVRDGIARGIIDGDPQIEAMPMRRSARFDCGPQEEPGWP